MRANRVLAVLSALIRCHADYPLGMTRGEIRRAAGLPEDTEITRPCRDLRKDPYNLTLACIESSENDERVWRYRLHDPEAARKVLMEHKPSTVPNAEEPPDTRIPADQSSVTEPSPSGSVTLGTNKCQTARHDQMPHASEACMRAVPKKHVRCWECGRCYTCNAAQIGAAS